MPLIINKILCNGTTLQAAELPAGHNWATMNVVASNSNEDLGGANDGSTPIEIYVSESNTPTLVDMVEAGALIPAKGRFELACRLINPGEKVFVKSGTGVAVRVEINVSPEN